LIDKCEFFPILYHYRIIEDDDNTNIETGLDSKLLKTWDHNDQIVKYLHDRAKSKYKIVMFLEHIPHVAFKYLQSNNNFVEDFYSQTLQIVNFLEKNGISHNDSHLGNYLVDDKKIVYLTNFGISLSKDFDLDKHEKKIYQKQFGFR
jgi:serine/threonine protein kinase